MLEATSKKAVVDSCARGIGASASISISKFRQEIERMYAEDETIRPPCRKEPHNKPESTKRCVTSLCRSRKPSLFFCRCNLLSEEEQCSESGVSKHANCFPVNSSTATGLAVNLAPLKKAGTVRKGSIFKSTLQEYQLSLPCLFSKSSRAARFSRFHKLCTVSCKRHFCTAFWNFCDRFQSAWHAITRYHQYEI